jgi:hypothetical protein
MKLLNNLSLLHEIHILLLILGRHVSKLNLDFLLLFSIILAIDSLHYRLLYFLLETLISPRRYISPSEVASKVSPWRLRLLGWDLLLLQ